MLSYRLYNCTGTFRGITGLSKVSTFTLSKMTVVTNMEDARTDKYYSLSVSVLSMVKQTTYPRHIQVASLVRHRLHIQVISKP